MLSIEKMEKEVVAEGTFVAHCVAAYICSWDDIAFWHGQRDAMNDIEHIFTMDGTMYAPTHEQAEEVVKIIINEAGNMEKDTIKFIDSADVRGSIGTVIAVARERYVRYNR